VDYTSLSRGGSLALVPDRRAPQNPCLSATAAIKKRNGEGTPLTNDGDKKGKGGGNSTPKDASPSKKKKAAVLFFRKGLQTALPRGKKATSTATKLRFSTLLCGESGEKGDF